MANVSTKIPDDVTEKDKKSDKSSKSDKSADTKSADTKSADTKSADTKSADTKSADTKTDEIVIKKDTNIKKFDFYVEPANAVTVRGTIKGPGEGVDASDFSNSNSESLTKSIVQLINIGVLRKA